MKDIEIPYGKSQDRRRDLIYRKLKAMYGEGIGESSEEDSLNTHLPISHFLLNISDYNPFSKKYYLRVQARREK